MRNVSQEVRDELECYPDILKKPDDLIKKLYDVYGESRSALELESTVHQIRQTEFEDVRSFSQRLHRTYRDLTCQQKKEGLTVMEDKKLRCLFLSNLRDDSLKLHLRQHLLSEPEAKFIKLRDMATGLDIPKSAPVHATSAASSSTTTERRLEKSQ